MATVNLDMPADFGNLDSVETRRQLTVYLYGLSEQLQQALNNIDDDNFSASYAAKYNAICSVSEKAKTLAAMLDNKELAQTKTVREMYQALRDSIVASADNVTASFQTSIISSYNQIMSEVSAAYYAAEPGKTLQEVISSQIIQMADQIRLEFSTLATIDAEKVNDLALNFKTYIRFSEAGVEIGKQGTGYSPIIAKLTNEQLQFVNASDGAVLAYISNDKLHIKQAEIESMALGNSSNGYIDFEMKSDGLSLKWRP
ncbi:MAG: hypothetical protein ACYCX2_12000 [Christensenellales bacterium]